MSKKRGLVCLVSIFALVFSVSLVSAQTEGIPLQKDVILGVPIYGPEDLPEEITFTLYDAQNGLTPLGTQTFTRGQYTVDFEFSQSDGVTGGSVARVKADFTQALNLKDASGQTLKPKELWAALEVAGAEVGARTKVSDETLVQLLLNSDASMATYLTLAYEGDDNPLTTIYKSLPLSFSSSDGTTTSLSNYFSSLPEERNLGALTDPNNWFASGNNIRYTYGNVGIGTTNPTTTLNVVGRSQFEMIDNSVIVRTYRSNNANFAGDITFAGDDSLGNITNYGYMMAMIQSNTNGSETGAFAIYTLNAGVMSEKLRINGNGNTGIGTTNPGTYKLSVNGSLRAKEIVVDSGWADFVFDANYELPNLNEVEQFILKNKHLPNIPTAKEVNEKGVSVGNISSKLLQKIEELTLYVIDIKKENEFLKEQVGNLKEQMEKVKH